MSSGNFIFILICFGKIILKVFLQIMCTKTCDVIQDVSFEEVELSTIITILDQDALNIDSELDIFFAINRYAEKHGLLNQNGKFDTFC